MGAAKWIGGFLGFITAGPLGALAGFILGSLFETGFDAVDDLLEIRPFLCRQVGQCGAVPLADENAPTDIVLFVGKKHRPASVFEQQPLLVPVGQIAPRTAGEEIVHGRFLLCSMDTAACMAVIIAPAAQVKRRPAAS